MSSQEASCMVLSFDWYMLVHSTTRKVGTALNQPHRAPTLSPYFTTPSVFRIQHKDTVTQSAAAFCVSLVPVGQALSAARPDTFPNTPGSIILHGCTKCTNLSAVALFIESNHSVSFHSMSTCLLSALKTVIYRKLSAINDYDGSCSFLKQPLRHSLRIDREHW
ncbi:hypothetical protein CSKR_103613 [Clonorchis sinensis]|uniref:Uncharacterized protein n=1 Tax=Clonorchis sinensis TaxID=79923 RepID=A0A419PU16_CLOSI|nr:hypothetical protein CSKR_103613 [Clonorchis sinensis]